MAEAAEKIEEVPIGSTEPVTVDFASTPAPTEPSKNFMADVEGQAKAAGTGLLEAFKSKDKNQTAVDRQQESRLESDREQYQRAYRAEGAAKDATPPPWNADKERAERIRGPMEQFGSVGSVFAMAASLFTRTPMTSALNAGAAAMKSIQDHDEKGYQSAYTAWLDNTNLAIKRFDMEHTMLGDADKLMHTDMQAWAAKRLGIASHFENQVAITMLNNGMYPELLQAEAAAVKGRMDIEKAKTSYLLDFEMPRQIIESRNKAFKAEWAANHPDEPEGSPEYNRAYADQYLKTITEVKSAERGYGGMTAQNVATFNAVKSDIKAQHPEWTEGEVDREAVRRLAEDKSRGRGGARDQSVQAVKSEIRLQHPEWTEGQVSTEAEKRVGQARLGLGGESERSPEALQAAAERYLKTGQFPPGMGGLRGSPDRTRIENKAAELAKERGINMEELPKKWQEFKSEQLAIGRFMSGPQGNTTRSLSVAIDHLGTVKELAAALKNGNIRVFNQAAQRWAEETGNPTPTDFDTAKRIVGAELIKAIGVAGAGTKDEREGAADQFNRARSPQQIEGAITVMQKLLNGQVKGLRQQFITATGLPGERFESMLSEEARKVFGGLHGGAPKPVKVTTPEEATKLTPGTHYVTPDGKEYVR